MINIGIEQCDLPALFLPNIMQVVEGMICLKNAPLKAAKENIIHMGIVPCTCIGWKGMGTH